MCIRDRGYSSLDSFATSSFDALKVDHSFVRDMVTNFRHRAIVRTITGFAEDLGLRLIAEGIETEEQAALLRDLGCTAAQGYLFAPALAIEDMERVLEQGLGPSDSLRTDAVAELLRCGIMPLGPAERAMSRAYN